MHCPRCRQEQPEGSLECARCGVVMAKYRPRPMVPVAVPSEASRDWKGYLQDGWIWIRERMFEIEPEENRILVVGRGGLLLILALWGMSLATTPIDGEELGASFMHLINLPFHEAGHFVFSPFGRFLHVLGGTLGQLLVPLVVIGAFLARRDPFGACAGSWWMGQSLLDCAPYIHDARAGELMLLGGVTGKEMPDYHDWEVMLGRLGWLSYDHAIARSFWVAGVLVMAASLVWGGYVLWKQARIPGTPSPPAGRDRPR